MQKMAATWLLAYVNRSIHLLSTLLNKVNDNDWCRTNL